MSAQRVAPGAQAKRFAAYLDRLAQAAEHADRATPLKSYCTGLLLPGERKSVEPMAARLYPDNVRQAHQSMHHIVADATWSDENMLEAVRAYVLPQIEQTGPVVAWIVDDTGFVKKGTHSVGVTRQYCGQVGKQENCRVAVSLSVSTERASLPIAWRLYLPEVWAKDGKRRKQTGVPSQIRFQTKPAIVLEQIRTALKREIPVGVGRKNRDVMLSPKLLDALGVYWRGLRHKPTNWLFPGNRWHTASYPVTTKVLWTACQNAAQRAGLAHKHIHPHTLRHYLPFLTMSSDMEGPWRSFNN